MLLETLHKLNVEEGILNDALSEIDSAAVRCETEPLRRQAWRITNVVSSMRAPYIKDAGTGVVLVPDKKTPGNNLDVQRVISHITGQLAGDEHTAVVPVYRGWTPIRDHPNVVKRRAFINGDRGPPTEFSFLGGWLGDIERLHNAILRLSCYVVRGYVDAASSMEILAMSRDEDIIVEACCPADKSTFERKEKTLMRIGKIFNQAWALRDGPGGLRQLKIVPSRLYSGLVSVQFLRSTFYTATGAFPHDDVIPCEDHFTYLRDIAQTRRMWFGGADSTVRLPDNGITTTWVALEASHKIDGCGPARRARFVACVHEAIYDNGIRLWIVENTVTTAQHKCAYNVIHRIPEPKGVTIWRISDTRKKFPALTIKASEAGMRTKNTIQYFSTGTINPKGNNVRRTVRYLSRITELLEGCFEGEMKLVMQNWCGTMRHSHHIDLDKTSERIGHEGMIIDYQHLAGLCWKSLQRNTGVFARIFAKKGCMWLVGCKTHEIFVEQAGYFKRNLEVARYVTEKKRQLAARLERVRRERDAVVAATLPISCDMDIAVAE